MRAQPITLYLPDTRGVEVSRFGRGNRKIGMSVYTYSRIAGNAMLSSSAHRDLSNMPLSDNPGGTCPGSTTECEAICYAKRIIGPVRQNYKRNGGSDVPELPSDCRLLRIHVSGDFDSVAYIESWIAELTRRPDVTCWAYTRSWRVAGLRDALEALRALPNVQLFASMDPTCRDLPPLGWRRAWIYRETEASGATETRLTWVCPRCQNTGEYEGEYGPRACMACVVGLRSDAVQNMTALTDDIHLEDEIRFTRTPAYVCPEETGRKSDCESCRYCFDGQQHDVVFLEH